MQKLSDTGFDFGRAAASATKPVSDISDDIHMREIGILLEHHAELPVPGRHGLDILAVQENLATIGAIKAGDDAQQGGLARTGRAERPRPASHGV